MASSPPRRIMDIVFHIYWRLVLHSKAIPAVSDEISRRLPRSSIHSCDGSTKIEASVRKAQVPGLDLMPIRFDLRDHPVYKSVGCLLYLIRCKGSC